MVLIHVKQGEKKPEFVVETQTTRKVGDVCRELVAIHNRAAAIAHFGNLVDVLLTAQPPVVAPHVAEMLARVAAEARALVAPEQAARRVALTITVLETQFSVAISAVTAAFAPDAPPPQLAAALGDVASVPGALAEEEARCWWANKELDPEKTLGDFCGRNEKTMITVRLSRAGVPPASAAPVALDSAATLAELRRRKDEHERLAADDDDSFLASPWADPRGLKRTMAGLSDVAWRF